MKLGLLMEAAQSQQALAAAALERLREHTDSLDDVVREEVRSTMIEELQAVADETRRAATSLRGLQRLASVRIVALNLGIAAAATAIPLGVTWYFLPSAREVTALRLTRDQLTDDIRRLSALGGRAVVKRCGPDQRPCVRVDRSAPSYGEGGDFLVIKGY